MVLYTIMTFSCADGVIVSDGRVYTRENERSGELCFFMFNS